MEIRQLSSPSGFEEVIACQDAESGLHAIIAIHNTALGPALGGCRMQSYASEREAVEDAQQLARAMTYKNALAELDFGGGKGVIIADPVRGKTETQLRAFGRFVDSLEGRFIATEDMGMTTTDLEILGEETEFFCGRDISHGGVGHPGKYTGYGLIAGLRAAVRQRLNVQGSFQDVRVAVQGLGSAGLQVARLLVRLGAELVVADTNPVLPERYQEELRATIVEPELIHAQEVDIFCPCARGGILNVKSVASICAPVIGGAANNQLADGSVVKALAKRDILYAPDYAINAGGAVAMSLEVLDKNTKMADCIRAVARIDPILTRIFDRASAEDRSTVAVANAMAEERFQKGDA